MKIICFDISGVLLRNCPKRMVWQIVQQDGGLRALFGYLIFDPNRFNVTRAIRAKVGQLFDHMVHVEGVELTNGRHPTEQGKPVSNSIQQWQRGQISHAQLLERIHAGLATLSYTTRYEQQLAALVANIVLTPQLHVKTKTVIAGMQELVHELAQQPVTLVITSNIDAGLAPEVRKRFARIFDKFHKFFGSHEMGVMKPNPAFFQTVITHYGVQPNQLLVIDDLAENIAAAHTDVGCRVFHFRNNPEQLRALLVQHGILS